MDKEETRGPRSLAEELAPRIEHIERVLGIDPFGLNGNSMCDTAVAGKEAARQRSILEETDMPATALDTIIACINAATDRIYAKAGVLEMIGDRVMGTLSQGGENAGKAAEPNGTVERTFLVLDYLDAGIDRLSNAVLRLERV